MSQKAEQREEHARWIIERHQLFDKRKEFLKQENEKIISEYSRSINTNEINSNKDIGFDTVDDAASVVNSTVPSSDTIDKQLINTNLDDRDHQLVNLNSPDNSVVELNSPKVDKQIHDAFNDLSSPQDHTIKTIDFKYSKVNHQSHSDAKALIYPPSNDSLRNKPDELNSLAININCTGTGKSDIVPDEGDLPNQSDKPDQTSEDPDLAIKSIDTHSEENELDNNKSKWLHVNNEDSESINLLYSKHRVNEISLKADEIDTRNTEGSETKSLLYPGEAIDNHDSLHCTNTISTRGLNTSGDETKDLLYPKSSNDKNDGDIINVSSSLKIDGLETKSLLYPDETINNPFSVSSTRGEFVDEGFATKGLLYPDTEDNQKNVGVVKNEGIEVKCCAVDGVVSTIDDGKQLKDMLYPGKVSPASEIHVMKDFERPSTMQSVIYPMTESADQNIQHHDIKDFERPSTMQSVIYPMTESADQNIRHHDIKDFERPSTMQSIIYPMTESADQNIQHHDIKDFERPSTMQSIIYPMTESLAQKHDVKEFERPSTMQSIIYPETNNEVGKQKRLYREFEPPTRIKELIYPKSEEKGLNGLYSIA